MRIKVESSWDGTPAPPGEHVVLDLDRRNDALCIVVEAPFHADPLPRAPVGSTRELWNHEVVELFLFGDRRYLEIELGPYGHYLELELEGARNVVGQGRSLRYRAERDAGRFRGEAEVPMAWLPDGLARVNAHAIHGTGAARRFLSALPAAGAAPDFHRLDVALPLERALLERLCGQG